MKNRGKAGAERNTWDECVKADTAALWHDACKVDESRVETVQLLQAWKKRMQNDD